MGLPGNGADVLQTLLALILAAILIILMTWGAVELIDLVLKRRHRTREEQEEDEEDPPLRPGV